MRIIPKYNAGPFWTLGVVRWFTVAKSNVMGTRLKSSATVKGMKTMQLWFAFANDSWLATGLIASRIAW